jgi:aquaporin Z
MKKLFIELFGTYFLVLIIGLSSGNPIAVGFGLMVLVYCGAHISGAHYNPAVTLAMLVQKEISPLDSVKYFLSQTLGSTLAALSICLMNTNMQVQPVLGDSIYPIFFSEIIFTFLLVFVILNVATHPNLKGNSFYGLAIGLTVMAGIFSVGPISGAVFNPAVSLGPSIIDMITGNGISHYFLWYYIVFPLIGSILAVLSFKFLLSNK